VILADEPTGNLDRVAAEEVLAALSETSDKGVAVVISTTIQSSWTVAMLFWRSERGPSNATYDPDRWIWPRGRTHSG